MEIREGRIFQEAESCIIDLLASSSFPAFLKGYVCKLFWFIDKALLLEGRIALN